MHNFCLNRRSKTTPYLFNLLEKMIISSFLGQSEKFNTIRCDGEVQFAVTSACNNTF